MQLHKIPRVMAGLLAKRNTLLILAILLGFALGPLARYTQPLVIPALAIAMVLSLSRSNLKQVFSLRSIPGPLAAVIFFNFVLLGGINLIFGYSLADDASLQAGFVILAAAPPAIAITPFSYALAADVSFALIAATSGYLAAMVIMPLTVTHFLGGSFSSSALFLTLIEIIFLPILASQLMRISGIVKYTEKYHATLINWCFAIITFSVVGLNRDFIINNPDILLVSGLAAAVSIIMMGELIFLFVRKLGFDRARGLTLVLVGTMKNWAGAGAIGLALFGPVASIPGTVALCFGVLYYVWLGFRHGIRQPVVS